MKLFYDTEFTGLHKNTTLISIGIISENDKGFYAELTDYNQSQVNGWIQENVIKNLILKNPFTSSIQYSQSAMEITERVTLLEKLSDYDIATLRGSKDFVGRKITEWIRDNFETIEWVSDVCHYDFVLLIDLLYMNALNIPEYHSMSCHDINQDIARIIAQKTGPNSAFNINRDTLPSRAYLEKHSGLLKLLNKHNALYDAIMIKGIYELIGGGDHYNEKVRR